MQAATLPPGVSTVISDFYGRWNRCMSGRCGLLMRSFAERSAGNPAKKEFSGLSVDAFLGARSGANTSRRSDEHGPFRSNPKPVHGRLSDGDLGEIPARRIYPGSNFSLEDAASARYRTKPSGTVWPYVLFASLGALLFGYHLGVVNGGLEYLSRDLAISNNSVLQGSIISTLLFGAIIGALTGGSLADRFGRAKALKLNAIPLAIGAFLCATAQTAGTMIIGRFISGIGAGVASTVVPLYISEIAPTESRGMLGSCYHLFISLGILASLVVGLPLAGNPLWWRTMFIIAVVPAIMMAFGMNISPESPRWLFQQGRISDAEEASRTLLGKEKVAEMMLDLRASGHGISKEPEANWSELLRKPHRNVVILGALLFLFQQLGGINAVIYYSTAVFRRAGVASDIAASALVSLASVLGNSIAAALVDKQGRKSLLLGSFLGMAASMVLLSFSLSSNVLAPYSGILAVLGTILYVISFGLGAGPVPAFLLPELFPSKFRAKGLALSQGVHWLMNFLVGLYFLSVVNKYGIGKVYLGFAAVCLLAAVYILRNLVETRGRSLELIERSLSPVA